MRADRSRRLAALEARPAPAPPCPTTLAFWAYLDQLHDSHGSQLSSGIADALRETRADGTPSEIAVAVVDFIEAIEQIDAQAGARLTDLLDLS
ncbi:hypothetical protein [Xanthomonas arboricola]|uniref:hypothetical protein n=1 Tax=Xanthomonas arboricola TaxID=56448 RepID=UPI00161EB70E|nr:hypothetical protein [Xanthomonas arboricola]MBB5676415.1 hypothetical protein [Xanthomonas arboricola]